MIEFVMVDDGITASIECDEDYLDESACGRIMDAWSRLVISCLLETRQR